MRLRRLRFRWGRRSPPSGTGCPSILLGLEAKGVDEDDWLTDWYNSLIAPASQREGAVRLRTVEGSWESFSWIEIVTSFHLVSRFLGRYRIPTVVKIGGYTHCSSLAISYRINNTFYSSHVTPEPQRTLDFCQLSCPYSGAAWRYSWPTLIISWRGSYIGGATTVNDQVISIIR